MNGRRFHPGWLQPYLAGLLALPLFWWMASRDLVAAPYWLLAGLVVAGAPANALALATTRSCSVRRRVHVRALVATAETAAVVYAMGWGPMLVVGFALGVADVVRSDEGDGWSIAAAWMVVGVGVGELCVALHWAPSLIDPNVSHAVALGSLLCTFILLRMFATSTRAASEAGRMLAASEQRFRSLVQHANDVIAVLAPNGVVEYVSPAIEELLGLPADACVGRGIDELQHDAERRARYVEFADHVAASGPGVPVRRESTLRHADGSPRTVEVTITAMADGMFVANLHDVTERRALEAALRSQALTDPLTRLPNRAAITAALDDALARTATAILYVDLDGFKQVNDRLGHEQGDRILVDAAQRLTGALGDRGAVGRLGGDEFLVVLPGVQPDDATEVANRIVAAFARGAAETALPITASVGLAISRPAEALDALVRRADEAMYLAKERGRARYCLAG